MRLTIYAHYGNSAQVAGQVVFYLEQLRGLGFQICFVSNSEISPESENSLKDVCERIIVRENTGLDFAMWQRGMAEYDLRQFDELLLTNSSIIGPLRPLALLWQNPVVAECDFWGLTDNDELGWHLQSYFLVFRKRVLHSARFAEFWRSVLPFKHKPQVIYSYELGLTVWLQEGGFVGKAIFAQKDILATYQNARSFWRMCRDYYRCRVYQVSERNVTLVFPDLLLQRGMPFVKTVLLRYVHPRCTPAGALALLQKSGLSSKILDELRREFPDADCPKH
jgi:lipopolysaccharide biosynthesis protein